MVIPLLGAGLFVVVLAGSLLCYWFTVQWHGIGHLAT